MAWRLHLTNQAIQRLDILDGDPPLLAVWSRRDRIAYYDLETGAFQAEQKLDIPNPDNRQSDEWRLFVSDLSAPNGAKLPSLRIQKISAYFTDDGRMRLYNIGNAGLTLDSDDKEIALDLGGETEILAFALDRFLGLSAALTGDGKLRVFQQHISVGAFDLNLSIQDQVRPAVAISRGGGSIFVTDGQTIVLTDSSGQVHKQLTTHYLIRYMDCSPDGSYLATSDADTGVIRIYNGSDLTFTHQRFAIDLVAQATQVQLIADLPPSLVGLSALTINNDGILAFAMSGVICITDFSHMDELPRPQELL
jgi:hypothetical protein